MKELRRVAVIFGGPSPEHDVSVLTGLQATHALISAGGYGTVHPLYWSKVGAWFRTSPDLEAAAFCDGPPPGSQLVELVLGPDGGFYEGRGRRIGRPERLEIDAAVICCHGGPGEDGSLQASLDLAGVSYTGPSASGAALGMDKLASAAVLESAGLPVLPRLLLEADLKDPEFPPPFIVKPRYGGSSIGIEVVTDLSTAKARLSANVHLRRGAVIEPYRPDLFDLQVAVRSFPELSLSEIERPLRRHEGAEILDYADKYVGVTGMAGAPRELPAALDDAVAAELRAAAFAAASALGCRGVNRIDFLSDGTALYLNEVNTIPGSLSRHLFVEPQLSFESLLGDLLREALDRPTVEFVSSGADGSLLRHAGSISAKLA